MEPLRAPAQLVAKEADTNNWSQNCVLGPYLESIFGAQKWALWLHTSISLAKNGHEKRTQKQALKIHNFVKRDPTENWL